MEGTELLNQKTGLEKDIIFFKDEIAHLKKTLKDTRYELSSAKDELEEERASFDALLSFLKERETLVEDLNKRIETLTEDLAETRKEKTFLEL